MIKIRNRFILIWMFTFLFSAEGPTVVHNGFQVTTLENEKNLQYSNQGYDLKQIEQNGALYIKPEMEGAGSNVEPGQPHLPTVSTFYAVDPGKTFSVSVTINEKEIVQNVDILPLETWDDLSLIHI